MNELTKTENGMNRSVLILAALALAALAVAGFNERGWRMAAVAGIGAVAGVALYHAAFGFTGAWRRMVRERRGAGLRAQMLLIALACVITFPLMAWGRQIGLPATGNILPIGLAAALGAFMFGVGMQLGGGCASGTLFVLGGGSGRMLLVLAFFVAGSYWATAHWDFWATLPRTRAGWSLPRNLGTGPGLAAMLAFLGLIALISARIERRRHGGLEPPRTTGSWLRGPWPLVAGAVVLAAVSVAVMAVTGRPWGITAGFALWGGKIAAAIGLPVDSSYWAPGWRQAQLEASVLHNFTSVMNFAIVIGAVSAAAVAGKFRPTLSLSRRDVLTAVIGGLLMGYGARLAYGCNIGAFLGGMVSGSLHGAWWLVWGFLGSILGTWLRGRIGMDPPVAWRAASASRAAAS